MRCIAFSGTRRIAAGDLPSVVSVTKDFIDGNPDSTILIFNDASSELIEVDFRGARDEVLARLSERTPTRISSASEPTVPGDLSEDSESPYRDAPARPRGRPRLGVVAREVTLLPRHWDWLARQPGGASAAVRRLVEEARQTRGAVDRRREAQEAAYRFMSAMAGDELGFEEATRALFACDEARFADVSAEWPRDVRDHARALVARAMTP
jgi:uncharacterized protein